MISKISFLLVLLTHFFVPLLFPLVSFSQIAPETRKSYLEDIFIWKMSDELKLSVQEEKKFSEIQKNLNKKKSDLNKEIQTSIDLLAEIKKKSDAEIKSHLNTHKNLLKKYNQLSVDEFESMRSLLGAKRFIDYLQIKNDLTNKVKSMLVGEKDKPRDEKAAGALPAPKVILQTE